MSKTVEALAIWEWDSGVEPNPMKISALGGELGPPREGWVLGEECSGVQPLPRWENVYFRDTQKWKSDMG